MDRIQEEAEAGMFDMEEDDSELRKLHDENLILSGKVILLEDIIDAVEDVLASSGTSSIEMNTPYAEGFYDAKKLIRNAINKIKQRV